MVKVMYNDQLVYKVVMCVMFGIILLKENVALNYTLFLTANNQHTKTIFCNPCLEGTSRVMSSTYSFQQSMQMNECIL